MKMKMNEVLYHIMAHELHSAEWHKWKQFEELCLITVFEKLGFVLYVPTANKGIILFFLLNQTFLPVNSYKYGIILHI